MAQTPQPPAMVADVFAQIETPYRDVLMDTRKLIFDVAASDPRIGALEETLRWGEPAYVTTRKKTGSTIRLGVAKASGTPALFFNCQTRIVEEMRVRFGTELTYEKNRAILLDEKGLAAPDALGIAIAAALTYHLRG
ncbi:DUF1801 domain-containing protein [Primorskyibacter sp. S187A]|uniref:DUF1801 domain-containing protein n=1 Tax=Primorskyibacter sp. S187A TaxID=3415130 RepID=UPI003C7B8993